MPLPLTALRHRNYRVYFFGQILSFSGTWMQSTLQSWIVYRMTQSAAWLGAINFCFQLPAFLLSPLAGVVADHFERRRLMIWVEALGLLQASATAVLVLMGAASPLHFAWLAILAGAIQAFELTGRHTLVSDLVPTEDLSSAIALNSVIVNTSRIAGPALAGVLIALVPEGWCFAFNALSFVAIIWGLVIMRLPPHQPRGRITVGQVHRDFMEGLALAARDSSIRRILLFATFLSFVGFPYLTLLPAIVKTQLGAEASTYTLLVSCTGLGAILGALVLGARIPNRGPVEIPLFHYSIGVGIGLLLLSTSHHALPAATAIIVIGFFLMSSFPTMNTYIQTHVDSRIRGRILSLYTMTFLGAMPIASLLAGAAADRFGVSRVIMATGGILVATAGGLRCIYGLRTLESKAQC